MKACYAQSIEEITLEYDKDLIEYKDKNISSFKVTNLGKYYYTIKDNDYTIKYVEYIK